MRHRSTTGRRPRNKSGGGGGGSSRGGNNNRSRVFDSNGPDVRIRGTAHQVYDKYSTLSKEALAIGDLVLAENYSQYAEHYQRIITGWQDTLSTYERTGVIEDYTTNVKEAEPKQHEEQTTSSDENSEAAVEQKSLKQDDDDLGLPESISGAKPKKEEILEDA